MEIEKILKITSNLPLSKGVVVNLIYTACIVNKELNIVLKPYGISLQQFNVLRILRGQKGNSVTLATIQERMIAKMSNTTRLVDKLKKKGYVQKELNKENKRKIDITITREGLELLDKIDTLINSAEKKIISSITNEEAHELIRLLEKIG
ncbi:MarR family winged helix-turn-helix transcriptional regulator [Seonamhaeicola maritimus]|uniref:MarR family winged helix-turn-helix transcriptional regulator n=1 Tax=Seonamhaeicola maritimus TaxID=2591822 RepID=UPI002494B53F|nr:MarR family transcriptional regulator [Seonamhaeicola maritimus]